MDLYIVGEIVYKDDDSYTWGFSGVFDDKTLAEEACVDEYHFVGPAKLNAVITADAVWPGAYYPKHKEVNNV